MPEPQALHQTAAVTPPGEYDLFLSHASPDKPWVLTLHERLSALGLRVFLDCLDIGPGDNFVVRLSDALEHSRYLVLLLSDHTQGRPWVIQEWTSWMAGNGPLGRLLPVRLDAVQLPFILRPTQAIDATHRDAERTAAALFAVVGDPARLPADDRRRLVLGRDLVFTLALAGDRFTVTDPGGQSRQVPLPWTQNRQFGIAWLGYSKLQRTAVATGPDRAEVFRHARTLGGLLLRTLFDDAGAARLDRLIGADRPRPVIQVRSDDPALLALPWELLHHRDRFLVRDGLIDLLRTTVAANGDGATLLKAPTAPFKLVVNVSAPEGSSLNWEAESWRITLATAERCPMVPTELGTLDDLVETVVRESPTGLHFSGHGRPGALLFEDDEGGADLVPVDQLIAALRARLPDDRRLPPFFFLASCHGIDPADDANQGTAAVSAGAALQLHQAGVTEVVGYAGPIVDTLSTRAEEALYAAIAEGLTTRDAVHRARAALATTAGTSDAPFPFAWAQLVLYRRGPEWPLSVPATPGRRHTQRAPRRSFQGFGDRRVLRAGFIGRRTEQHRVRRRLRAGERVLVFQGLGGLGKSTLAQRVLPWLSADPANLCTLWCQEAEGAPDRAAVLVDQLLAYCRRRFGLDWEPVVQQVDRAAGADPAARFLSFLQVLVEKSPGLVLYLDNLESLLIGPTDARADQDPDAFADWAEPALATIWREAQGLARDADAFHLIASCRYRNPDLAQALLPVGPLPADALFRLTEWFPALARLAAATRARLVERLAGHPRAVEYANDLLADALARWRDRHGEWSLPEPPTPTDLKREWRELVEPALPRVAERLRDNLLLQAIWERVLDAPARDFLYRMTVLRRPAEWALLGLLGEPEAPAEAACATAERLRATSLLEQQEARMARGDGRTETVTRYSLHPATVRFIAETHPADANLIRAVHRGLGDYLEAQAKDSVIIETHIEAGHHLSEAGEADRAFGLLGSVSNWLQQQGRVREGLALLAPFLDAEVRARMAPALIGQMLGTLGSARYRLAEVGQALSCYEQQLTIAREIGDRRGEGNALGGLGIAHAGLGEVAKAIGYYEQQLVIVREFGDRLGEGDALGNLGLAYAYLGEVDKGIGYHEQRLVIAREIGDRRGEGTTLANLGIAYAGLDEVEKARSLLQQAQSVGEQIRDPQIVSVATAALADLLPTAQ